MLSEYGPLLTSEIIHTQKKMPSKVARVCVESGGHWRGEGEYVDQGDSEVKSLL